MKNLLLLALLAFCTISYAQDEIKYKTAFDNVEQNCDSLNSVEFCYLKRFQFVVNRKFTDELRKNSKLSKNINDKIYLEVEIDTSGTIVINKIETKSSIFEKALLDLILVLPKIKSIKIKDNKVNNWEAILEFKLNKLDSDDFNKMEEKKDLTTLETPRFSACKSSVNEETNKNCFSLQMNNHIKTNFSYPKKALNNNISGRTFGYLVINKEGEVGSFILHGANIILQRENLRILKLLPTFIPGKLNGKNVSVSYVQPLLFKLN